MLGSNTHHGIDYIEFPVKDFTDAKRFYAAVFGWTFNEYGTDYIGIKSDGSEMGGFRKGTNIQTGGPLVILYSLHLEDTLHKVESAGGKIVTAPFNFPGGRRFHFTDPSGNELAVWTKA